jgi:hypothetical protein
VAETKHGNPSLYPRPYVPFLAPRLAHRLASADEEAPWTPLERGRRPARLANALAAAILAASVSFGAIGQDSVAAYRHAGVLPDPALTPGAVRTTDMAGVCTDRHTRQYRHWSREQADRILHEYGLPPGP